MFVMTLVTTLQMSFLRRISLKHFIGNYVYLLVKCAKNWREESIDSTIGESQLTVSSELDDSHTVIILLYVIVTAFLIVNNALM